VHPPKKVSCASTAALGVMLAQITVEDAGDSLVAQVANQRSVVEQ
jgi:hypothetical protein